MNETSARPVRTSPRTGSVTVEVKRRACDECRSRKLACSKESEGCTRCTREGISCHYSAQKPMGRPRKRRNTSHSTQVAAAPVTNEDGLDEDQAVSCAGTDVALVHDSAMALDPRSLPDASLAYHVDMPMSDMSFLDFLGSDFMVDQPFNADEVPLAVPIDSTNWTTNLVDVNVGAGLEGPDSSPSLPSQTTPPSAQAPSQPTTCSCLARLYLALDSIAHLPTEVMPALHAARTAAHTAHDALRCDICCPPIHKTMKMTATTFQNSMLLGALIPSIADAYHQILGLVDAETRRAIATHTQLTFTLSAYGGMWGTLLSRDGPGGSSHDGQEVYENKVMEPAAWRLSVRSLLKIDVYGVNTDSRSKAARFRQIGLRELVAKMDEKSSVRHAEIDALIEAGLPAPVGMNGLSARHTLGKEPHCRHVIQLAREAVDSLYIA